MHSSSVYLLTPPTIRCAETIEAGQRYGVLKDVLADRTQQLGVWGRFAQGGIGERIIHVRYFGIRLWFTSLWPEGFASQRIYDEAGKPIEAGAIERHRER